jgi:hypothetical protein
MSVPAERSSQDLVYKLCHLMLSQRSVHQVPAISIYNMEGARTYDVVPVTMLNNKVPAAKLTLRQFLCRMCIDNMATIRKFTCALVVIYTESLEIVI